jgi:hypothetical protein
MSLGWVNNLEVLYLLYDIQAVPEDLFDMEENTRILNDD